MHHAGLTTQQVLLLLDGSFLGGVLFALVGWIVGDVAATDPASWIAPIVGNATAAGILAAVVLYLGPQAIKEWKSQHDRLVTSFFGDERSPGAVGRITEQMNREREQCAVQFEKLMSSVTAQQEMMRQLLASNQQLAQQVSERATRIEGLVQARHITAIVDPTRREGYDPNSGGR